MSWMETNRVLFSLLTYDERAEMILHGGPYMCYHLQYKSWFRVDAICSLNLTYRVIPRALTKPYIDWSQVSSDFNFLWSSKDGLGFLSKTQPRFSKFYGLWANHVLKAKVFSSFTPGTCKWQDSVVERPT